MLGTKVGLTIPDGIWLTLPLPAMVVLQHRIGISWPPFRIAVPRINLHVLDLGSRVVPMPWLDATQVHHNFPTLLVASHWVKNSAPYIVNFRSAVIATIHPGKPDG